MRSSSTSIWLMATLLSAGPVWADINVNIPGQTKPLLGAPATNTLTFSDELVGTLDAAHITVTPQTPGSVNAVTDASGAYVSIAATSPIQSFSAVPFTVENGIMSITHSTSLGGFLLTATSDGFTNTGGSLAIDNISTDLGTQTIYADILGGNGVGAHQQQAIAHYTGISGSTPLLDLPFLEETCPGGCQTYSTTGLTLDTSALTLFSQSLGLTPTGQAALSALPGLGTLTTTIGVVPEPSAMALMGIGLLGMGIASRRRHRATASST